MQFGFPPSGDNCSSYWAGNKQLVQNPPETDNQAQSKSCNINLYSSPLVQRSNIGLWIFLEKLTIAAFLIGLSPTQSFPLNFNILPFLETFSSRNTANQNQKQRAVCHATWSWFKNYQKNHKDYVRHWFGGPEHRNCFHAFVLASSCSRE